MSLFKNHWFRWFAVAFVIGAALPPVASVTDYFQDLEVGAGNISISGTSAWVIVTSVFGIFSGIFGLGIASLKTLNRKSSG